MNRLVFILLTILLPLSAHARTTDRQQPMNIEADNAQAALQENEPTTITGNIVITQGSMKILADKGVLYPKQGDIARAVFNGAPVKLNQLMNNSTPMEAVAQGVDYDLATDIVVFTGGVVIKRPGDVLEGERVVYDLATGKIQADGPAGSRVRMRIAPRPLIPAAGMAAGSK